MIDLSKEEAHRNHNFDFSSITVFPRFDALSATPISQGEKKRSEVNGSVKEN